MELKIGLCLVLDYQLQIYLDYQLDIQVVSELGLGIALKFILWLGSEVGLGVTVSVGADWSLVITEVEVSLRLGL